MKFSYVLSTGEMNYIHRMAMERALAKKESASKKFDTTKTEVMLHEIGIGSEYAFGKMFNLEPNLRSFAGGDGGFDFMLNNGITIDVKARTNRDTDFALTGTNLDTLVSDIGALMWPTDDRHGYEFVGWTTRTHILFVGEIMHLLKDRLCVPYEKLLRPEKLAELVEISNGN